MRLLIVPIVVTAAFVASAPPVDLAAAPPAKNAPLKFWFGDNLGDRIRSDGLGVYQDGAGVTAFIDKGDGGRLVIYNGPQSPRRFTMELTDCLAACDELPFVTRTAQGQFLAGMKNVDGSAVPNGMLGMAVGSERLASFHSYLGDYNSAFWTLCRVTTNAEGFCGVSDNSTPARVVRTALDTWTFTASSTTTPRSDVAELVKQTGNNRTKVISLEGTYSTPFTLTVQCVNAADCP